MHAVNGATSTNSGQALFKVRQAMACDQPVAISNGSYCGKALPVVFDDQRERIGVEAQTETDFRCTGVLDDVVKGFFEREEKIVT